MVNVKGYLPGREIVILGSGDIGLIMSRRMTLEGAKVHAVCEIMPYSSGLKRNIVQCLDDFDIPLYLNHTITEIQGKDRVTGATISQVDENKRAIKGTEKHFDCDCVLFSVGLIPENELTKSAGIALSQKTKGAIVDQNRQTEIDGIYACGNVLHVHDLVDYVSEESEIAGSAAANYVLNGAKAKEYIECENGKNITYVLPQKIGKNSEENVTIFFRVNNVYKNCKFLLKCGEEVLAKKNRPIALPGEMETITLKKEQLCKLNGKIELLME
jgi:thioredoxin reductase